MTFLFCKDIENIIMDYKNEMEFTEKFDIVLKEIKNIKHEFTRENNCVSHSIFRFGDDEICTSYTTAYYEQLPNLYVETHYEKYISFGTEKNIVMLEERNCNTLNQVYFMGSLDNNIGCDCGCWHGEGYCDSESDSENI